MIRTVAIAILAICASINSDADIVFTWKNCPDHLAGSATMVWQGTAQALNYSTPYTTMNDTMVFQEGWLHDGVNYFACQQIATNKLGQAASTSFSGEIQVIKNPMLKVDLSIMTSTNLGMNWVNASTQTVMFPTTDAQRFFMASQIKATRASQVVLPPSP